MPKQSLVKKIAVISFVGLLAFAPIASLADESQASKDCGLLHLTQCIQVAFEWVTEQIAYVIAYVASFLISLAATIIQILINASKQITQNPLVLEGFKISLSIANLGFVLAIIVIAYITILRISGYETKKLLRNLIIAALLVNFSFAIAGVIIDLSNVFGNYFLAGATPDGNLSKFSENLANSLNIQKLVNIQPQNGVVAGLASDLANLGKSYFAFFTTIAAVAIFSVFLVITFYAVAFMMLIRFIFIVILLILMPIAWLMWIFPGFSQHWSAWWDKFIKWNLFYPAISFFLYLSTLTSQKIGAVIGDAAKGAQPLQAASDFIGVVQNVVVVFVQTFVQVGIVLGGLIAAEKLGLEGAAGALKMAGSAKNWIIGATGRLTGVPAALRAGRAAAVGGPIKTSAGWLATQLTKPGLRWIPGAKTAAAGLAGFSSRKQEVEEYQKKYLSPLNKEQWDNVKKSMPIDPVAQTAQLAEAVKRKDVAGLTADIPVPKLSPAQMAEMTKREDVMERIGFLSKEQQYEEIGNIARDDARQDRMKKYAASAQKTNPELVKEIVAVDPQMAPQLTGKSVEETASKLGGDKVLQLSDSALSNAKVVLNLSEGAISTLMRSGSKLQAEKIASTIKEAVGSPLQKISAEIASTQRELKLAPKLEFETIKGNLRKQLEEERRILASASEAQRKAYSRLEIINQRIGSKTNLYG